MTSKQTSNRAAKSPKQANNQLKKYAINTTHKSLNQGRDQTFNIQVRSITNQTIHQTTNQTTNQTTSNQATKQAIDPPIYQKTKRPIAQPIRTLIRQTNI